MLELHASMKKLDMAQLKRVYSESIAADGRHSYCDYDINRQILEAEQDFYQFVCDFLRMDQSLIAVWAVESSYKSVLRLEPYLDGFLLTGLETLPEARRKGYAFSLIEAVIAICPDYHIQKLYSHIKRSNHPSLALHNKLGFHTCLDYAVYVDATVDCDAYTLVLEIQQDTH